MKFLNRNTSLFAAAFVTVLLLVQCKPAETAVQTDEDAPEIFMSSPWVLPRGEFFPVSDANNFALDIRFEDDVELKEYLITVSYAYDQQYSKTESDLWNAEMAGPLTGLSDGINTTMPVVFDPSAGPYDFIVTAWDKDGKSTTLTTYLYVTNSRDLDPAVITISNPDTAEVDTFQLANNLVVQGMITDNVKIREAMIRMRNAGTMEVISGTEIVIDSIMAASYVIDTFWTGPLGLSEGDYIVEVYAVDGVRNTSKETAQVYLR